MMKKNGIMFVLIFLLLGLSGLIYRQYDRPGPTSAIIACADLTQACFIPHTSYQVYTDQQPGRLTPFLLTIEGVAKRIEVSFTMQGMEMGPNQYQLIPNRSKNKWQARVMLPLCIQGRRDWRMHISVDQKPLGHIAFHNVASA